MHNWIAIVDKDSDASSDMSTSLIDGVSVASSHDRNEIGITETELSINTIQEVQEGQTISIHWKGDDGTSIYEGGNQFSCHWTGEHMFT